MLSSPRRNTCVLYDILFVYNYRLTDEKCDHALYLVTEIHHPKINEKHETREEEFEYVGSFEGDTLERFNTYEL